MPDVILVDTRDYCLGSMEKIKTHERGLLHRAFSVFIFNPEKELLLQQRAISKYHSSGLWSNTCCGHPAPGERTKASAEKRLYEEMGFTVPLKKRFHFVYQADFDNGLTEYEFDHVFIGRYEGPVSPDKDEVAKYQYKSISAIKGWMQEEPELFTAWFHLAFPLLEEYLAGTKTSVDAYP